MGSVAGSIFHGARRNLQTAAAPLTPGASAALDQWRGIALLIVLASHGLALTERVTGMGRIGVNLFFFISGLLVYRSLARGPQGTATDWTGAFWWRRLRRLLPALLVYLAVMVPVAALLGGKEGLAHYLWGLPYALTFTSNYPTGMALAQLHLWSLACEVQFYLAAPLLFLAGGNGAVRRSAVWGGVLGLTLILGIMPALTGYAGKDRLEFAVWPLVLGFVAEAAKERLPVLSPRLLRAGMAAGGIGFAVAIALIVCRLRHAEGFAIAGGTGLLLSCFLAYRSAIVLPGTAGRVAAWLGKRTYSIYLWQEPFTLAEYLPDPLRPLGVLMAIPVGALSYRWLERPFLSTVNRRPTLALMESIPVPADAAAPAVGRPPLTP